MELDYYYYLLLLYQWFAGMLVTVAAEIFHFSSRDATYTTNDKAGQVQQWIWPQQNVELFFGEGLP